MRDVKPDRGMRAAVTLTIALALAPIAAHAQEADRVVFRSGNPLLGEIKELRRGTLDFDTEEMDVVPIDWDDISFLTSSQLFVVTDIDGNQYTGSLGPTTQEAMLVVVRGVNADTLVFSQVVEITSINQGFFARTNGFVDVGMNLARANDLASVLLKGRFAYSGPIWEFGVNGET